MREGLITVRETVKILKDNYGHSIKPNLIKCWVNRGIIKGPKEIEGNKGTDGGGKIGYYESNLPEQIAAILHYKGNGYPLLSITSEMIHQFIANIEVT